MEGKLFGGNAEMGYAGATVVSSNARVDRMGYPSASKVAMALAWQWEWGMPSWETSMMTSQLGSRMLFWDGNPVWTKKAQSGEPFKAMSPQGRGDPGVWAIGAMGMRGAGMASKPSDAQTCHPSSTTSNKSPTLLDR